MAFPKITRRSFLKGGAAAAAAAAAVTLLPGCANPASSADAVPDPTVIPEEDGIDALETFEYKDLEYALRDTFELLRLCVRYGKRTGGLFDVTTKPLSDGAEESAKVDYRDLMLDEGRLSARLRNTGQGIHLGGIAKGYAVDRVAELLQGHGVKSAVINLGGTVRNIGRSERVGIRNPFDPEKIVLSLDSVDEAVVTSGLYERGNHIFDPVSGRPAISDLASVTVVGKDGAAADVAATACMVSGSLRGISLLRSMGLEGVFILRDGGIFATKNIRERVKPIQTRRETLWKQYN